MKARKMHSAYNLRFTLDKNFGGMEKSEEKWVEVSFTW